VLNRQLSQRVRVPGRHVLMVIAATGLLLASCATTADLAPPIDALLAERAVARGMSVEGLERGRLVYITKCTNCHSPEPVTAYAEAAWPGIIQDMAPRTGLDEQEQRDVLAYVRAISRWARDVQ